MIMDDMQLNVIKGNDDFDLLISFEWIWNHIPHGQMIHAEAVIKEDVINPIALHADGTFDST